MGILSKAGFLKDLGELWEELRRGGQQDYWSFVRRGDFREVVKRAYGVSFMLSYGYAEASEENGRWSLRANEERKSRGESVSVAISLQKEGSDG